MILIWKSELAWSRKFYGFLHSRYGDCMSNVFFYFFFGRLHEQCTLYEVWSKLVYWTKESLILVFIYKPKDLHDSSNKYIYTWTYMCRYIIKRRCHPLSWASKRWFMRGRILALVNGFAKQWLSPASIKALRSSSWSASVVTPIIIDVTFISLSFLVV